MPPRWLLRVLSEIRRLAADERVHFTAKALEELGRLLLNLEPADFAARIRSRRAPGWMYVFLPEVAGIRIYLKIVLAGDCRVISFHEDEADAENDEA